MCVRTHDYTMHCNVRYIWKKYKNVKTPTAKEIIVRSQTIIINNSSIPDILLFSLRRTSPVSVSSYHKVFNK